MSGKYETPISIKEAIDHIDNNDYLLPAIQRKFVWNHEQIEALFDSILRGYPLNSFMLWRITDSEFDLKDTYNFYRILTEFRERFQEENPSIDTRGMKDFDAIIDGQQRLTSIYIGLKGSYAFKKPYKHWKDDEDNLPTRRLYLNLEKPQKADNDIENMYEFKFLPQKESKNHYWFEVGKILSLKDQAKVAQYAQECGYTPGSFAWDTLFKLYERIYNEHLINYYRELDTDPDKVLNIFVRTNGGGKPLSFSDLLMSMSTSIWKTNARDEIRNLIKRVMDSYKFDISQDFILKTCLVLCGKDIRFKLKNFTKENITSFEENWERISKCIEKGIELVTHLGHNNYTIQAKNALIPIIYFIYLNNLEDEICKNDYYDRNKENNVNIQKWLNISILKGVFGGHTDSTLNRFRKILQDNPGKNFPFTQIVEEFKNSPINYTFDDDFLDELLKSQKDTREADCVLSLLYPEMDYYNQNYHADHLHPKSHINEIANLMDREEDRNFVKNKENWNSIINLQLLEGGSNSSKNDMPLQEWVRTRHKTNADLYLPKDTSLDEKDFVQFIRDRRKYLKGKIRSLIGQAAS